MGLVGVVGMAGCQLVAGLGDPQPYPADVSCTDNEKNGNETGVDCGGSACGPCGDGDGCLVGTDCTSKVCLPGHTCAAPTCEDMTSNGDETGVDCGGLTCDPCAAGSPCSVNEDCVSGSCANGVCAATCTDMEKNGDESDVDCGGSMCPKCPDDKTCGTGGDCQSGVCQGTCQSNYVWANRYGDANAQGATALAVDNLGQSYLLSRIIGAVDFGGGALSGPPVGLPQKYGIAFAKIGADGGHVWSKIFPGFAQQNIAVGAAFTSTKHVWVTGACAVGTDLGGGPVQNGSFNNMFVAKYDEGGNHLFSLVFPGVGDAIASASLGSVVVAGAIQPGADFGCGVNSPGADIAWVKYSSLNSCMAHHEFSLTSGFQTNLKIAVDPADNVALTGTFAGSINFGGGLLMSSSDVDEDVYVASFASDGTHLWSKRFGDSASQRNGGIAFDANGDVILAGTFKGTIDLGGGAMTSAGDDDIFVVKLGVTGNHLWSKRFGDASTQYVTGVHVNAAGEVILSGSIQGTVDFGGGPLVVNGPDAAYIAVLDASGAHLWSRAFDDPGGSNGGILGVTSNGLIASGSFNGTIDFGGGPLTTAGLTDIFLARLRTP